MSIVRELPYVLQAGEVNSIVTCSTANQSLATTGNVLQSTTAALGINGRVIDRLGDMLSQRYQVASPFAVARSTRGSTEAARAITIGVKLQHGNSSGGGDMADYSTGSQPADATFFTTAGTTPQSNWSTGPLFAQTNPAYYDLRAASRFVRAVITASKNKVTTESSGDEGFTLQAGIAFMGAESLPMNTWTSQGSTSTST